ncbi:protease inhibitor I42 family protein [Hyphomonas sp.]|jgi:predicted secreted protein|uniref:protease inhibitor I42 family protein n=1 Tax=Hyphomonas sp. TaxID=87 RepID=UPI0039E405CD
MVRSMFPAALAGPFLAACMGPAADPVTELPDGLLYAGAEQAGGEVAMQVGQTLRIELESIPTAGYVWEIEDLPDFVELADEATRPTDPGFQNQPGVTGGNHFMAFDLTATAPGTATLHMVNHRPWEGGEEIGTWRIDITVTPAP